MKEYIEELSNEKLCIYTAKVLGLVLDEKHPEGSTMPNTTVYTLAGCASHKWNPIQQWEDMGILLNHFHPSINWFGDLCYVEIFYQNCLKKHLTRGNNKSFIACHYDVRVALCKAVVGYYYGHSFDSEDITQ